LHHENLVALHELHADGGRWFFTMELVDGVPFLDRVRPGGRLDSERLRDGLAQLARGLGRLHDAGIVHRDLKPSNVLRGGDGRGVLRDFGLAAERPDEPWAGTAAYLAPEGPRTPAADWYAVGVMLYEALTGALPFAGHPLDILARKQRAEAP